MQARKGAHYTRAWARARTHELMHIHARLSLFVIEGAYIPPEVPKLPVGHIVRTAVLDEIVGPLTENDDAFAAVSIVGMGTHSHVHTLHD